MKETQRIRLLIVDDHYFVRTGLRTSLGEEPGLQIVGDVGSAAETLAAVVKLRPQVVILDNRLPDLPGPEVGARLLREHPELRVIIHSIGESEEEIGAAVRAGAHAYVPKSADRSELIAAIRAVCAGQRYFPTPVITRLIENQQRLPLSPRELEVLRLIAQGLSNKEIGERFGLSEPTVKMHVGNLLLKLNASDRAHAVAQAARRGILLLDGAA